MIAIDEAAQKIWDYMLMHHELRKADLIFVLGSRDTRTAEYAADLYLQGWAPLLLLSGSGTIHEHEPGREKFAGTTEADLFAVIARERGVPESAILIENCSQNTGENYAFSTRLLKEKGIPPKTVIAVQKPYMERRTYATGKKHWPDVELIVTSPPGSYESLPEGPAKQWLINSMVGDLQRIKEYPVKGFQIPQEIPTDVLAAYEFLVSKGYTERRIQ